MSGKPSTTNDASMHGEAADDENDTPVRDSIADRAVTFRLDGQLYGLPLDAVLEIQHLVEPMPLPDSDPSLMGLIDLRGVVVPAINLRVLVGLEARPFTLQTPMIFCRLRGHFVALVVDSVEDVVTLPMAEMQAPSGLYSLADKMLGMVRIPQGLVLFLDVERLVPAAVASAADAASALGVVCAAAPAGGDNR